MPAFDPIGFFLPLAVAVLYLYRALQHWRSRNTLYMALLAFVTYLVPIKHPNGVGLVPLYVLLAGGGDLSAREPAPLVAGEDAFGGHAAA